MVSRTAYGDESEPDQRLDPGTYLLAAAVVDDAVADDVRAGLRAVLLPGQRKLHWHDEAERRRKMLSGAVAELEAVHLVVVRTSAEERSERRRALCLQRLLPELEATGVSTIALESREARQNEGDLKLLAGLRSGRHIGPRLRMTHPRGPEEALLWLADIVAGAVAADRRGQGEHLQRIEHRVRLLDA